MRNRLLASAAAVVIAAGTLAVAVLLGQVVVRWLVPALGVAVGFSPPEPTLPPIVDAAARQLLWPVARPFGLAPSETGAALTLATALAYLLLTLALAVGLDRLQE